MANASVTRSASIPAATRAKDILRKFLAVGERVPMDAIVVQKSSCSSTLSCQFKLLQDSSGRRMMVAVQPLSIQGLVSFDDGRQWTNYFPDERRMVVMPSPRIARDNADLRIQLASQNYRFVMETSTRVAGRQAEVVVVIPRNYGLATKRFTIDSANDVLLRVESIERNLNSETIFETKSVQFLTEATHLKFSPGNEMAFRVFKPEMPSRLANISLAKEIVGFVPVTLHSMPFGFTLRESSALQSRSGSYVTQRWTDGIVSATLYQFASGRNPLGASSDGLDFSHNNVTLRLVGDIPYEGKRIMMEQIARSLGRTLRPLRELGPPVKVLPTKRLPEHEPESEALIQTAFGQSIEKAIEAAFEKVTVLGRNFEFRQRLIEDEQHN
jgi:hypothetical protein